MNISNARSKAPLKSPRNLQFKLLFQTFSIFRGKVYQFQSCSLRGECTLKRATLNQELETRQPATWTPSPRWLIVLRAITTDGTQSSAKVSSPAAAVRSADKRKKSSNFRENFAVGQKHGLCAHTESVRRERGSSRNTLSPENSGSFLAKYIHAMRTYVHCETGQGCFAYSHRQPWRLHEDSIAYPHAFTVVVARPCVRACSERLRKRQCACICVCVCVCVCVCALARGASRRGWWETVAVLGGGGCKFLSEGVRGAVGFQGGWRVVAIGVCRWQTGYQATGNKGAWIANGGPQYTPSSNTACFPCLRARQKELLL